MAYSHKQLFIQATGLLSYNPGYRLKDLASKLNVDRHTLLKTVKTETLMSFREYRRQSRLKAALTLLLDRGNTSEKEVASKVGYQSVLPQLKVEFSPF